MGNPLVNFVDKVTNVDASWLNGVDVTVNSVLNSASTPAQARVALVVDAPWAVNQGGTGAEDPVDALNNLGGIGANYLTQQTVGGSLYPVTVVEQALGVAVPAPWLPYDNVARYGWSASATGAANAAAMNAASAVAIQNANTTGAVANDFGMTFKIPAGIFTLAQNLVTIPQGVIFRGAGKRATYIQWTAVATPGQPGPFLFILGNVGVSNYGCGISDISIQHTGTVGANFYVLGTVGAELSRIYCEGETIVAGRATYGLIVDGGNISTFFNSFRDLEFNHLHFGIVLNSSGNTPSTQNYFSNCNGTGDRLYQGVPTDTTSVGVTIGGGGLGAGQFSVFNCCDFEGYGTALHVVTLGGNCTFVSFRTENNTTDYQFDTGSNGNVFLNCNPINIIDSTGTSNNQYIGCFTPGASGAPSLNQLVHTQVASMAVNDVPMVNLGFPGQTSDLHQWQNNTRATLSAVDAGGNFRGPCAILTGVTRTGSTGQVSLGNTTATSASAGTATLPATPAGFLVIDIAGTKYKLPYYNA